jgi:hypothetical protein
LLTLRLDLRSRSGVHACMCVVSVCVCGGGGGGGRNAHTVPSLCAFHPTSTPPHTPPTPPPCHFCLSNGLEPLPLCSGATKGDACMRSGARKLEFASLLLHFVCCGKLCFADTDSSWLTHCVCITEGGGWADDCPQDRLSCSLCCNVDSPWGVRACGGDGGGWRGTSTCRGINNTAWHT